MELGGGTANTFTGGVNINAGTLQLNKTAGVAIVAQAVNIGDNAGADALKLIAASQIDPAATVTVQGSGTLDLNNQNQTLNSLGLVSGLTGAAQVTTGTGTLTLGGN